MSFLTLILGIFLLVVSADFFVVSCSKMAKSLGIPSLIVGLTIVAMGTSAPEAAVSITASVKGMNDISLGNVVGSNICNLLLILGCGGLFGSLTAKKKVMTRDFRFLIFSSAMLLILTFVFFVSNATEGIITRVNGFMLLGFLALYLYMLVGDTLKAMHREVERPKFEFKNIFIAIIGILGIILGGELIVNSVTAIATMLNVSEKLIALTIVAIGTSLPELVTSVVAVRKGESDIAVGNVVGSNIFNIYFVLGLSSAISPITFATNTFIDVLVMFESSVLVYVLLLMNNRIGHKKGKLLLFIYALYMIYILIR